MDSFREDISNNIQFDWFLEGPNLPVYQFRVYVLLHGSLRNSSTTL